VGEGLVVRFLRGDQVEPFVLLLVEDCRLHLDRGPVRDGEQAGVSRQERLTRVAGPLAVRDREGLEDPRRKLHVLNRDRGQVEGETDAGRGFLEDPDGRRVDHGGSVQRPDGAVGGERGARTTGPRPQSAQQREGEKRRKHYELKDGAERMKAGVTTNGAYESRH